MSFFLGVVHLDGGSADEGLRARLACDAFTCRHRMEWHRGDGFIGVLGRDDRGVAPAIARVGTAIAIGVCRLDNASDTARRLRREPGQADDLTLLAETMLHEDSALIARLIGDFAVVVWDPAKRQLLGARDVFGVRKLYYSRLRDPVVTFGSRASVLASGDEYDVRYLAERIAYCTPSPARTVYAGVQAVPPASVMRLECRDPISKTYWSVQDAQVTSEQQLRSAPISEQRLCETFRQLLIDAVRVRLPEGPDAWSHLSGGLDSSSVVSVAQWLARLGRVPHGLGGTVTYVDDLATGADEREYSDAVVAKYGMRNELIPHRVRHEDLLRDPPLLDQPDRPFPAAARDCAAAAAVRDGGGRVLLTGLGGDNLVLGTMFFFADWLTTGRAWKAIREMAHRAALGRVSFWELAYRNALLPVLTPSLRDWLTRKSEHAVPHWIPRAAVRRFDLDRRRANVAIYGVRAGHRYEDAQAATIGAIPTTVGLGPLEDALDLRHPFLHRPLVEFALGLGPEMCVRPHARKWILREAMRGILPEHVRTRVGKGTSEGLSAWSLIHDHAHARRLLRDPILGQLGCLDAPAVRALVEAVGRGQVPPGSISERIHGTLEVELWLQLRSGRWAADGAQHDVRSA